MRQFLNYPILLFVAAIISACSPVQHESKDLASTASGNIDRMGLRKTILDSNGEVLRKDIVELPLNPGVAYFNIGGLYKTSADIQNERDSGLVGATGSDAHSLEVKTADADGVIVELRGSSVSQVALQLKGASKDQVRAAALARRADIKAQHDSFKSRAVKALGKSLKMKDFSIGLNGVAIKGLSLSEAKKKLAADSDVQNISADTKVEAVLNETIKILGVDQVQQIQNIDGQILDGTGTTIGVVDTGVDYRHADLGGCLGANCKVIGGYDFSNNDADPLDDHGHGTHVAATAAGRGKYVDSTGVTRPLLGMAPGAKIYAIKVLNSSGSGSMSNVISGLEFCGDPNRDGDPSDHVDVCTLSLGGPGNPDDPQSKTVDNLSDLGVVFTIAAGNSGGTSNTIGSPGTARKAITVAASCKPGDTSSYCNANGAFLPIATFSSRGPVIWTDSTGVQQTLAKPDITAPGVNICAAQMGTYQEANLCLDGDHIKISGTSMATPHVAGLAAILLQAHRELRPSELKNLLKSTAKNLGALETEQGAGQADIMKALQVAGLPSSLIRINGAFQITDVPTKTVQTYSSTYTITNTSGAAVTLTPSFESSTVGLTAVYDKSSLVLNNGASTSLVATFTIDHTKATAGIASGKIVLTGAASPAKAGVIIDVGRMTAINIARLDFKAMDPRPATLSKSRSMSITNKLTDTSVAYNISVDCCYAPTGQKASAYSLAASQNSVTIAAGQTSTVNFSLNAINSQQLDFGFYTGKLVVSSAFESLEVPIRFFRGYGLRLNFGSNTRRPAAVIFLAQQSVTTLTSFTNAASTDYYWYAEPPYGFMVGYSDVEPYTFMAYDSVPVDAEGASLFNVDPSQATRTIGFSDPIRPDGSRIGVGGRVALAMRWQGMDWSASFMIPGTKEAYSYRVTPPLLGLICTDCAKPGYTLKTNDLTANFPVQFHITPNVKPAIGTESYLFSFEGVSASSSLANSASGFITRDIQSTDTGTQYPPRTDTKVGLEGTTSYWYSSLGSPYGVDLPYGKTIKHYTTTVRNIAESASNLKYPPLMPYLDYFRTSESTGSGTDGYTDFSRSPYFQLSSDPSKSKFWTYNSQTYGYDYATEPKANLMGVDLPPGYSPRVIKFQKDIYGSNSFGTARNLGCEYRSSADDVIKRFPVSSPGVEPIETSRDGVLFKAVGTMCMYYAQWLTDQNVYGPVTPGNYDVKQPWSRYFNGQLLRNVLRWKFTVPSTYSEIPLSPPTITGIRLMSGGSVSATVLTGAVNTLDFEIDPQGSATQADSLASLKVEISADGNSWSTLPVTTLAAKSYRAPITTPAPSSLYWFRVTAVDSVNSTLEYTFQMTSRAAVDSMAPIAKINSPVGGAILKNTATVSASASDDFGVTKMELFVDDQLVAQAASSQVSYSWDTTYVADGTHSLQAKAYDATGKVGSSAIVTVTVANSAGDTTPPTAPTSLAGQWVRVNRGASYAYLSWNSSTDNLRLGGYRVYRNGVKIADTNGNTYYDQSVPSGVSSVSYYVVAYDMAGNVSPNSNTVTIAIPKRR